MSDRIEEDLSMYGLNRCPCQSVPNSNACGLVLACLSVVGLEPAVDF